MMYVSECVRACMCVYVHECVRVGMGGKYINMYVYVRVTTFPSTSAYTLICDNIE